MVEELNKAEILFNEGKLNEALELLNEYSKNDPFNIECLLLRAKAYYKMQRWGDALNDLNSVLNKEPENKVANNYKSMVINIISFWNKDNYNP